MKKLLPAFLSLVAFTMLMTGCTTKSTPPTLPAPPTPLAMPTSPATQITPALDAERLSNGGGEPRSAAYWLLWNACAPDNRADVAAANGGRAAGWVILDDLLAEPGLLLGELQVETCLQAIQLLQRMDMSGNEHADEPAYQLASQLLTAQLNLSSGAETCLAAEKYVKLGQLLLLDLHFNGQGDYAEAIERNDASEAAAFLIEQLASYNAGELCR